MFEILMTKKEKLMKTEEVSVLRDGSRILLCKTKCLSETDEDAMLWLPTCMKTPQNASEWALKDKVHVIES